MEKNEDGGTRLGGGGFREQGAGTEGTEVRCQGIWLEKVESSQDGWMNRKGLGETLGEECDWD